MATDSNGSSNDNRRPRVGVGTEPPYRTHVLFPVLDYLSSSARQSQQTLQRLERSVQTISEVQEELMKLIKEQHKKTFSLKAEGMDKALRFELASLYCQSLFRKVTDSDLQKCVRKVLRSSASEKHKSDQAFRFLKQLLSTFKTEERRRVYGIAPCKHHAKMSSVELANSFFSYMKGPEEKLDVYTKHLALLRKFIRDKPAAKESKHFFQDFEQWVHTTYSSLDKINWTAIMEEDSAYDYLYDGMDFGDSSSNASLQEITTDTVFVANSYSPSTYPSPSASFNESTEQP